MERVEETAERCVEWLVTEARRGKADEEIHDAWGILGEINLEESAREFKTDMRKTENEGQQRVRSDGKTKL